MSPIISVIVPIYNIKEFVERCVSSIINQNQDHIEIILVDDGSTDGSSLLCDQLAARDSRISVVHRPNGGLGEARNSGLEVATGKFVSFIDGDDYIAPDMYSELLRIVDENKLDACYSGFVRESKTSSIEKKEVEKTTLWKGRGQIESFLFSMIGSEPTYPKDFRYSMSVCTSIFRKHVIDKNNIRFQSERKIVSEDLFFNLAFLDSAVAVGMSANCYYHYVENQQSLSHHYDLQKFERNVFMADQLKRQLFQSRFSDQRAEIYIERLLLARARSGVRGIASISEMSVKNKHKYITDIMNNSRLQKIFEEYPIKDLPLKQRIFTYSMKYQFVFVSQVLVYMQGMRKKW